MSIPVVTQSHIYGAKGDLRHNVAYLDEQTVLYPAGANLVLYTIEQKSQKFIPIGDGEAVTAMCISKNARYVAVAERGSDRPLLSIFDLHTMRKRKTLVPLEGGVSKEYVALAFSQDSRYLITQTGAPDWTLAYWGWEKGKVITSVKSNNNANADVVEISLNPHDKNQVQICVIGNNLFRIYRLMEGMLRPLGFLKTEHKNHLCHTWISVDRIAVGTEDAKISVYDSGELRFDIPYYTISRTASDLTAPLQVTASGTSAASNPSPNALAPAMTPAIGSASASGPAITAIIQIANGFMVGTSNGTVSAFEQGEDFNTYKRSKEIKLDNAKVNTIAFGPTEDVAAVSLGNNQIYSIQYAGTDVSQVEEAKVELLAQSFHFGSIVGLDTCIRKPLVATCSTDKSVRIWNYHENNVEVVKVFPNEPQSIAIHPSGLHILVGFTDSLKLMNVLIDDIRPVWESTSRGCRECRFSNGGHYFATVMGSTIQIYSTWSCQVLYTLRGHEGKVKSVSWSSDDTRLVSCALNGSIIDWHIKTQKMESSHQNPAVQYTSAVYWADTKTIYAVGNDCLLKELNDGQVSREIPSHILLTQVLMSKSGRMMFTATATGGIRAMKFPFGSEAGEYQEQKVHAGPVTRLRVSYDDLTLFSCGEDGCLVVYKLMDREIRGAKREKDVTFSDEILVARKDMKSTQREMTVHKNRVEELRAENEVQLRMKELYCTERLRETTASFSSEMESLRRLAGQLREDRVGDAQKHDRFRRRLQDSNRQDRQEIDNTFDVKMASESRKFQELETETRALQDRWRGQMRDLESSERQAVADLAQHYQERLKERQDEILGYQLKMGTQLRDFEFNNNAIENDAETEIIALRHEFERRLCDERESVQQIKQENLVMKKRFEKLTKDISDNKIELNKMFVEKRKLHNIIKSLEKDIFGVKREMQERDDTIQDKEKRVYDLKKKNQELEKFKFVLDYKIMELKKQVEPREHDIIELSKTIRDMDLEIGQYQNSLTGSDIAIAELSLKVHAKEREVGAEKARYQEQKNAVLKLQQDIAQCYFVVDNPKHLRSALVSVHQQYSESPENSIKRLKDDDDPFRELRNLEKTISTLEHKSDREKVVRRADNEKIIQENVLLIHELNYLRRELKVRKQRLDENQSDDEEIVSGKEFKLPLMSLPGQGMFVTPMESK